MKLAVTGSRHWANRKQLWTVLDTLRPQPTVIIHGGAGGADEMAHKWALDRQVVRVVVRPAASRPQDYLNRNDIIVSLADYVIAFRASGKSNGTDYTITAARRAKKLLEVVNEEASDCRNEQPN